MKRRLLVAVALLALCAMPLSAQTFTSQIQQFWNQLRTGVIAFATGRVQAGGYMNFGNTVGVNGYGFRDSAGTMQFKDSGGAWNAFPSGGVAPATATYILQTANAGLPNGQAVGALATGLMYGTTTTGVLSSIVCGTVGTILQAGAPPTCTGAATLSTSLGMGSGVPTATIPFYLQFTVAGHQQVLFENLSTNAAAYMDYVVKSGSTVANIGSSNQNFAPGLTGGGRAWLDTGATSGNGWDYSAPAANGNHRFATAGYAASNIRLTIDSVGLTLANNAAIVLPVGTGMAVANVGANSCGTTAASIAGNNNLWTVTVGATAGTQCRVAFTVTAASEWGCAANDDTNAIAVKTTPVDTTHLDISGGFTAGDKVTGICFPR